jgi:beta-barrel assembly-enhancing protease
MRLLRHNIIRQLLVLLSVCVLEFGSTVALAQSEWDLPDIGNPAGSIITRDEEWQIGQMIVREIRQENGVIEDAESAEYIQALGSRLAAQGPEAAHQFQYFVVRDSGINAFALPGGFIGCNYGTILVSINESQLAGVLAHETAHITQRHIARAIRNESRQSMATMAAILGAILIGAMGGGGQAVEAGIAAAEGLQAQGEINFTRQEENEADRVGMNYLSKAGFDPEGMPDFFQALMRTYGYEEGLLPKILLDHPVTTDRIADAKARAAQMDRPRDVKDSVSYSLIRERLRVITAEPETDIVGLYTKRLETRTPALADQYGEAIALLERGHPTQAVEILEPLVARHDSVILLHTALGQAQVAAGQVQDGLNTFAHAEVLFPRNVPLTVRYAEALIKAGQAKQAHALLLDVFNLEVPTPEQIKLTASAASAAGDVGDAYYYMGQYYLDNGNLQMASHQLELALQTPNLTTVQHARFQALLTEIRDFLASQRRTQRTADQGGRGGLRALPGANTPSVNTP